MSDGFLSKSYGKQDAADVRAHYDAWAASYEDEIAENGYATPGRCAEALAKFMPDKSLPVLDYGCGTGLSGLALKLAGYDVLDGMDLSAEMIALAEAKGIYRNLVKVEADQAPPVTQGDYAAITAVGVIGAGAAPITLFDTLMRKLGSGGKIVLSFNDHALADPKNEAKLNEWLDCAAARLLFKDYGDHLPGINLKSNVYVIEKA